MRGFDVNQSSIPAATQKRFWNHVRIADGCWEWFGGKDRGGYGILHSPNPERRRLLAHRVSWELHRGAIPAGMFVLHTCDNRSCVNPAHLFLGTHASNMRDMTAKGRQASGVRHSQAKLTDEAVLEIRAKRANGTTQPALAALYGVSQTTISRICQRVLWRHLPPTERSA